MAPDTLVLGLQMCATTCSFYLSPEIDRTSSSLYGKHPYPQGHFPAPANSVYEPITQSLNPLAHIILNITSQKLDLWLYLHLERKNTIVLSLQYFSGSGAYPEGMPVWSIS